MIIRYRGCAMKISNSVERIDNTMANSYVIRMEGHIILVDTGTKGSGKRIVRYFRENGEKPDIVLITHYHMDHIGGLKQVVEEFSPRVLAPPEEVPVIKGVEKAASANSFVSKMVSAMTRVEAVDNIESAENINLNGIKAVATHGHTPGSTSYYLEDEKMLFVGDALTNRGGDLVVNKGFTLDVDEAEKSREKILAYKGALILPGHGDPLKI